MAEAEELWGALAVAGEESETLGEPEELSESAAEGLREPDPEAEADSVSESVSES